MKTSLLRDAIRTSLLAGATLAVSLPAFAQDAPEAAAATTLDRIEVTGSRIRQVDMETAQPVLTISRADIEGQGFRTVSDILQNMTAAGSPAISRSESLASGEAVGGQYIDLRNLGANRTLVLVNGKRLGITTDGLQDVASIPSVMVDRIEILKDGASSIYGSDAMAGVVNIITRKNFDGAEANAYYGQFGEGDGAKESYDFIMGMSGERGSLTLAAEYHKEDGVWARDRWFSRDSYPGFPQYSLSPVGKWGNYNANSGLIERNPDGSPVLNADGKTTPLPADWRAPNRGGNALGSDAFHPQTADDMSNAAQQMHVLTPLERRSLYVNGQYDLTDNVRFSTDIGYNNRVANSQIAGYPVQSTAIRAPMAADSYFNPLDDGRAVDWRRRGWENPRTTESELTTWRFTAGLDGAFEIGDRYFDWDAGYLYNKNELSKISNGNFYIPNVRNAVGSSFLDETTGNVVCGTPGNVIAGCTPWNPFAGFGTGGVANSLDDQAVRDYLFKQEHALGETETTSYFANLAGSIMTLPAGDLGFAVGYEYRKEQGGYTPDAISQSGNSTNLAAGPTYGEYDVDEFYVELNIPVLADMAFAQELSFNLASRYSDFSTFGDTTNNKFGVKWRPINDLLVRGTWAEGFRAPTISDLYGGGSQTFTTGFRDPCDSEYGTAAGSQRCLQDVAANYRQLQQGFIPTEGPAAQTPVPFTSGSNPNLSPETAESKTIGVVYSPSWVEGLSLTLDWWNITIENTLVSDSPNQMLSDCYISLIESRCSGFSRDPVTGIVNDLTYGLRNAGYQETEGFDFDVSYRVQTGFGNIGATWQNTYVSKNNLKTTNEATTPESVYVGFGGNFRLRSNLNMNWENGPFSANWGMRYYSSMKEECYFDSICNIPDYAAPDTQGQNVPMNETGSNTFHDVQFAVKTPWNATVAVGANNVFNHYAAPAFDQPNSNFAYYGGFDLGRFVFMKYQQRF
ncbi:TonB-dependent receptor [Luteimonas sp. MC1828]|uniref:TonB-dependent receptor domain-containing protein n=1 Tax=Luteimonas sp. MC1828 TaxID=2799787 RepID=UPI0018F16358|nr:TonB-dependent receptor [Luteimonas sp. MC1828]MBJ7576034.1 TonB-dependent receptor [Luteimonas sp. MC1828]